MTSEPQFGPGAAMWVFRSAANANEHLKVWGNPSTPPNLEPDQAHFFPVGRYLKGRYDASTRWLPLAKTDLEEGQRRSINAWRRQQGARVPERSR